MVNIVEQGKLVYCFDIDETICKTTNLDYENAQPILERIIKINSLFDNGHRIKLLTARGSESGIDWRIVTENQLSQWGLKYHELHFGKPAADLYIDDKAINERDFIWN